MEKKRKKKAEHRLHHPNIKMAHIPPSAPHLLWLARPRAVRHANGVSYESGPDTGPPGKTDDTFHYTLNNCRSLSVKLLQRRGVRENPAGQGTSEKRIGCNSSISVFPLYFAYSCRLSFLSLHSASVWWLMQTKHNRFTVGSKSRRT